MNNNLNKQLQQKISVIERNNEEKRLRRAEQKQYAKSKIQKGFYMTAEVFLRTFSILLTIASGIVLFLLYLIRFAVYLLMLTPIILIIYFIYMEYNYHILI